MAEENRVNLPLKTADWPEPWRHDFEERAGILEYDAHLTRKSAELWAEKYVRDLYAESWESLT
jgi:hypothetical protein